MSLMKLSHLLYERIGDYAVDPATLSRYESSFISEEKVNPVVMWALADALGVPLSKLAPKTAAQIKEVIDRMVKIGSRCSVSAQKELISNAA
jgi:transcriptional regulator with XRE-family HTH domain